MQMLIARRFFIILILIIVIFVVFYLAYKDTKNTYLVGYEESAEGTEIETIIENHYGTIENHYPTIKVFKVTLTSTDAQKLRKEEKIRYVEKDSKVKIQ